MSKRIVSDASGVLLAADGRKTRRAALGAMASAAVLALPATSLLASRVDPVFPAIERHKAARAKVDKLVSTIDEVLALLNANTVSGADWIAYDRAVQNRERAFDALLATPPETTKGMRTVIAYILGFDEGYLAEFAQPLLETLLKSPLLVAER